MALWMSDWLIWRSVPGRMVALRRLVTRMPSIVCAGIPIMPVRELSTMALPGVASSSLTISSLLLWIVHDVPVRMVGTEHRVYGATANVLVNTRLLFAMRSMYGVVSRW